MDPLEICSSTEVDIFLKEGLRRGSKDSRKEYENNNYNEQRRNVEFTNISLMGSRNLKESDILETDEISQNEKESEDASPIRNRFTGLILALLGCVAFSLSTLIVKYLSDYHPLSKSVWRFQGIILPSLPMMLYSRCYKKEPIFDTLIPPCKSDNWKNIVFLLLRSSVGFATIILQYYSLQYISLADQMVLGSSQPVFVVILAYFMLDEKCGFVPFIICVFTILGVFIVAKPPMFTGAESYDNDLLIGSSLAIGSMLMSTMSIVFMRRLKDVHVSLITFTFGIYSGILSLIAALILGVFQFPVGENHILLAILMASFVFVSQTCTTMALKFEQAGPVSLTRTSNIVFAFLWQYIFLSTVPDGYSILGAAVISIGVILTAIRKWVSTLPENSKGRRFCGFILF